MTRLPLEAWEQLADAAIETVDKGTLLGLGYSHGHTLVHAIPPLIAEVRRLRDQQDCDHESSTGTGKPDQWRCDGCGHISWSMPNPSVISRLEAEVSRLSAALVEAEGREKALKMENKRLLDCPCSPHLRRVGIHDAALCPMAEVERF
jgi:hypothetical protein